ncbi:sensor histidine kinase [Photobacterium minamisatsumaniensis]|uniref:sensor histidine kinase n=1 Tax=Photobacterium minamisatsumaniensis TaxID=2910233 RepID=UPI003D0BCDC7
MNYFSTFLVYLFYGLAFFSIGCTILFRNFRNSKLKISHSLWALAAFSFAYAFYEWSELYINLFGDRIKEPKSTFIEWLRLTKLTLAYSFLLLFSWMVTDVHNTTVKKIARVTLLLATSIYAFIFIHALSTSSLSKEAIDHVEYFAHLILAFPAALIAGLCLIYYGQQLTDEKKSYGRYFRLTGYAFILMSVVSGIIPVEVGSSLFYARVVISFALLIALYQALDVFDKEKERIIESHLHQAYISDKYKAIGQLASGVAHEINNPLASSTLSLDMLESRVTEKRDAELIKRTRLGIDRAATICKELLNYSRSSEEKAHIVYVYTIIDSALQLLAHKTRGYNVDIQCDKAISILANPIKIEELIINLVSNAIDASNIGSDVKIAVHDCMLDGREYVQIAVSDQGCGIDTKTLSKVTDPFFTTKPIGKGTGLGLTICSQIATDHNGELTITSTINIGTTVTAKLAKEI